MKKSYIYILVIMLVFALFLSVSRYFKTSNEVVNNDDNKADTRLIIPETYQSLKLNVVDDYSEFDVMYPYFNNIDITFNNEIKSFLDDKIKEHKVISKENWQARYHTKDINDDIKETPSAGDKFSFFSDFDIVQSNLDYISIVLHYGGYSGGAHGYENLISFNYNLKNKKELKLNDILINETNYLEFVSEESRKILIDRFANIKEGEMGDSTKEAIEEYKNNIIDSIKIGTKPEEENFSVFTFDNKKINIYFAEYQVGPYAIGTPIVFIDIK